MIGAPPTPKVEILGVHFYLEPSNERMKKTVLHLIFLFFLSLGVFLQSNGQPPVAGVVVDSATVNFATTGGHFDLYFRSLATGNPTTVSYQVYDSIGNFGPMPGQLLRPPRWFCRSHPPLAPVMRMPWNRS
jgi:hypothetical protein